MELENLFKKDLVEKLKTVGINSVEQLATISVDELAEKLASLENKHTRQFLGYAGRLIKVAKDSFELEFVSASKLNQKQIEKISTGSKKLDEVLGGGIEVGNLTEIAGAYGTGKTCMAFTIASIVAGNGNSVIFFDTENTFVPDRVLQIAKNRGFDDSVLDRIYVIEAPSIEELKLYVDKLNKKVVNFNMKNPNEKIKLIVIDSIMSPFRSEYIGRAQLAERQQTLSYVLRHFQRIAIRQNLAVFFTNQVLSDPTMYGGLIPAGGNVLGHTAKLRMFIKKIKKGDPRRIVTIFDSPNIPETDVEVRITERGIE